MIWLLLLWSLLGLLSVVFDAHMKGEYLVNDIKYTLLSLLFGPFWVVVVLGSLDYDIGNKPLWKRDDGSKKV